MEENNEVVEQTTTQEEVQAEQPAQAPEINEQVSEPTDEQEAQTVSEEPTPEAPKQEEPEVNYDLTRFLQPQPTTPQFQPDEDGYIDPNQFYNKVLADAEARIEQKLAFQESERRAWQSIEQKYPEIKEDAELRDLVNAQRIADVARGGKGDLNAIAGKVLGKIQSYQTIGKAQAQVSEKIQKSASLQKSTANNVDSSKDSELLGRMRDGDLSAADQLISEWLDAGKL
jgi:hypothetical protein